MFGFSKKAKPPADSLATTPPPDPKAKAPASRDSAKLDATVLLLASIQQLRAGKKEKLPLLYDALSRSKVWVLLQEPGRLRTPLVLDREGTNYLAVFLKPELAQQWRNESFAHAAEVSIPKLCLPIVSNKVGLTLNPGHDNSCYELSPEDFMRFRETLLSSLPAPKVGGLYCVRNGDGTFSPLKVLKVDDGGVHLRQYSNAWPTPPASIDEATLYLVGVDRKPEEKLGMGHVPVSKQGFAGWATTFIQQSTVSDEELEGYKKWLETKGSYL